MTEEYSLVIEIELLQTIDENMPGDLQQTGCLGPVSPTLAHGLFNKGLLHIQQRDTLGRDIRNKASIAVSHAGQEDLLFFNTIAMPQDKATLDNVLQLSDITGPAIGLQKGKGRRAEMHGRRGGKLTEKMVNQGWDILPAVAQGGEGGGE